MVKHPLKSVANMSHTQQAHSKRDHFVVTKNLLF